MSLNPNKTQPGELRRDFLTALCVGLGGLSALIVAVPVVGFLLGPLLRDVGRKWRVVGPLDKFKTGDTVEVKFEDASPLPWAGVTAETGAWLRRNSQMDFVAFSVNCSHLGCPVRWEASAKLFMCPCHGGVYYSDGSVAGGPPPRGLTQYPVRIRDGNVEILTSPIPIT